MSHLDALKDACERKAFKGITRADIDEYLARMFPAPESPKVEGA